MTAPGPAEPHGGSLTGQVLIFDADDTLWENNVLFERAVDDFLLWLDHPTLDGAEIRAILNSIQAANAVAHGYGGKMFLHSLKECLKRLRERPASAAELRHVDGLAAAVLEGRVELVPDVAETLTVLGGRHELLLLTKGDTEEQQRKLDLSGLVHHFRGIHIVAEKDVDTYRRLTRDLDLAPAATWMIGNSPKSDILPARQAGMNAVFIPNDNTWVLEHSELDDDDEGVLRLRTLSELLHHF
ncbi:HAD family hydrolase [Nonomuraea turcica]|uniref:HAD family hydrolase n=1 Tax=Nonomuraea sp. G32 TaxID=3067274 RepID=UPI00273B8C4E|nr:HAD family hydrolase [Nonomuraea sp. G32]MDP4512009.1 HAD family hydrolase [Nonomuraea sp. G32]